MSRQLCSFQLAFLAFLAGMAAPAWAVPAGTVEFVLGDVRIRAANGVERRAAKGSVVEVGETVVAASNANAQMRMVDNAFLAVRPDTELVVSEYSYSGRADGSENALLRLVRGTMRAFTGAITQVRKDSFVMRTATSTIGIRGSGNVAHYSPALGTINHTIEGSHVTTSINQQGQAIGSVITNPGQTVQVQLNQPPVRIPTPTFILQAVTAAAKPAPGAEPATATAEAAEAAPATSTEQQAAAPAASTTTETARVSATSDTALATIAPAPTLATTTTALVTAPPPAQTELTGSTSTGTIDLSSSTLTTSTGTEVAITPGSSIESLLAPLGNHVLASYYYYTGPSLFFGSNDFRVSSDFFPFESTATFAGPNGNLSSVTEQTGLIPGSRSLVIGGDTSAASTVSTVANGISFGRYSGVTQNAVGPALTVSGVDHQGSFTGRNIIGDLHWITGPGIWPLFGSEVLTGTASYSVAAASSPTDQNNATGTLNSATFSVNFDRQAVDTSLDVTLPGSRHWVASASNIALKDGGGFHADTDANFTAPLAHRSLTVSLNGDSTNNASGNVSGQLTGPLMSGAILSYTLGWGPFGSHEHVNGVVGFGSPSFSAAADMLTPYRIKLDSLGSPLGFDSSTGSVRSGLLSAAAADHDYLTRTMVSAHDPVRLQFDSQGALTAFDTRAPVVSGGATSCSPNICNVVDIASRFSINPAGSSATSVLPAMPTIASGPATVAEFGFDAATGISWGRYSSGNFAVADRVTGSPIGSGNFDPGPINHYLLTPVQSGPMTLPTTGTAVYTFAGGTSPTDSFGNAGTLNSATLNANFSARTVDTGVNLSVGGRTWSASASALPILGGIGFTAEKIPGSTTGTLAVTCTGCASSQLAGQIVGGFAGSSGQGAGIAYTLNSGGLPQTHGGATGAVTVGGVAAFRR